MSVPDPPLDVIYVIACHLAGMFAFGTLAALYLTNHNVAETVLPVLYETVLVDDMKFDQPPISWDDDDAQGAVAPLGSPDPKYSKYIKYLISSAGNYRKFTADTSSLPNLVAILDIAGQSDITRDEELWVVLHRPITTATLFGIIAFTPTHRSSPKFEHAKAYRSPRSKIGCARELVALTAKTGASLISNSTTDSSWTTQTRPFRARCDIPSANILDSQASDTIFEVMKLAGRLSDPQELRKIDALMLGVHGIVNSASHIEQRMQRKEYDAFAERFPLEVALHPEILLNRIDIYIQDGTLTPSTEHKRLVDDLLPIYSKHVTSYSDITIGPAGPDRLFNLHIDLFGGAERFSVQVKGEEGDMRFTTLQESYRRR